MELNGVDYPFTNITPPRWNVIRIIFKKEGSFLLSDKDMETFKKGNWIKGDLIEDSIKLAKEDFFKIIQNISFEEFEKLIKIEKEL